MRLTYLGHGGFFIETAQGNLMLDPFVTPNELAKHIDLKDYKTDFLLLTHGHQDHVYDVEKVMKLNPKAKIIANFEIATWYQNKGYENVHAMNHGGSFSFGFGDLKMVNAVHSSMLPDGSYGGNAAGFVIHTEGKRIYFSGDTALTMDMKLIGAYDQPDLSGLCMGDNFTMGIRDAVICSDFVQCNHVIGMHYDTFPPIKMDRNEARAAFDAAGKKLDLPAIGEAIQF